MPFGQDRSLDHKAPVRLMADREQDQVVLRRIENIAHEGHAFTSERILYFLRSVARVGFDGGVVVVALLSVIM